MLMCTLIFVVKYVNKEHKHYTHTIININIKLLLHVNLVTYMHNIHTFTHRNSIINKFVKSNKLTS